MISRRSRPHSCCAGADRAKRGDGLLSRPRIVSPRPATPSSKAQDRRRQDRRPLIERRKIHEWHEVRPSDIEPDCIRFDESDRLISVAASPDVRVIGRGEGFGRGHVVLGVPQRFEHVERHELDGVPFAAFFLVGRDRFPRLRFIGHFGDHDSVDVGDPVGQRLRGKSSEAFACQHPHLARGRRPAPRYQRDDERQRCQQTERGALPRGRLRATMDGSAACHYRAGVRHGGSPRGSIPAGRPVGGRRADAPSNAQ